MVQVAGVIVLAVHVAPDGHTSVQEGRDCTCAHLYDIQWNGGRHHYYKETIAECSRSRGRDCTAVPKLSP